MDDLRVRRLDGDDLPLREHVDLLVRAQAALFHCAAAQALYGVHDIGLLGDEGLAEARRPGRIFLHAGEQLGKGDQRLDAGIPVEGLIGVDSAHGLATAVSGVGSQPLRGLGDFIGIAGRHQDLR